MGDRSISASERQRMLADKADRDRIEATVLNEIRKVPNMVAGGVAEHVADPDPHPQYASDADISAAVSAHAAASGAHPVAVASGASGFMSGADKAKLDGVAAGATANATDAALRDRSTHTGSQLAASISDFGATVRSTLLTGLSTATATVVAATDTVLAAIGKLQAQITARALASLSISTTAPLSGGGDLTANRTLSISAATTGAAGSMSAADKSKLDGVASGATANSSDAFLLSRGNHTGTQSADTLTDGTTNKAFLAAERTKLAGIATGATANATDAALRDRSTHTGTQLAATISDFASSVLATVLAGLSTATSATITAADSILGAMGKLQAQITNLTASVGMKAPSARLVSTLGPLTGGGDLSADRVLGIDPATSSAAGSMSAADKAKLDLIASGTYTPTLTGVTNIASLVAAVAAQYIRVGNQVTVSGRVTATASAAGASTEFAISLPIASNFATGLFNTCNGTAASGNDANQEVAQILPDDTNDRARVLFYAKSATAKFWSFHFTYTVFP